MSSYSSRWPLNFCGKAKTWNEKVSALRPTLLCVDPVQTEKHPKRRANVPESVEFVRRKISRSVRVEANFRVALLLISAQFLELTVLVFIFVKV